MGHSVSSIIVGKRGISDDDDDRRSWRVESSSLLVDLTEDMFISLQKKTYESVYLDILRFYKPKRSDYEILLHKVGSIVIQETEGCTLRYTQVEEGS